MVYGAIDLHMRYSQIRVVDEQGAVVREQHAHAAAQIKEAVLADVMAFVGRSEIRDDITLLEDLGAEVRDVEEGLVDFRSLRDGRDEVHLCWRLGDREITSFHDGAQGWTARQPSGEHAFLDAPARLSRQSTVG